MMNLRRYRRVLSVLMMSSLASVAMGQGIDSTRYGPTSGESILSFGGSLRDVDGTSLIEFSAGLGRFLTEEHEVGGQLGYADADDATFYFLSPYYNYNFRQSSRTWYYVGPHVGVVSFDFAGQDETELSYGVHAGVRQWLTPSTSFFVEPRFTKFSSGDETGIFFGLTIFI